MAESPSNSSNNSPPDTPMESEPPVVNDGRTKRFDYLLKQTEVFSHFMGGSSKAKSPLKVKQPAPKQKSSGAKNSKVGDNRHRKTEEEEDEELLTDLNK